LLLLGVKEVENGIWLVSFMDYDLGYIDLEEETLQHSVTHVSGPDKTSFQPFSDEKTHGKWSKREYWRHRHFVVF
jgi:hypothetical protein